MFARKVDDSLAGLAKQIDDMVGANADKHACGTVVLLASKDEVAPKLEAAAKEKKIVHVPLTVSDDGVSGPPVYALGKDVPFTVVVYGKNKKVTETFTFDKLDAKSQDQALAAFAKVLGVDPPKATEPAKDEPKKDEPKKAD